MATDSGSDGATCLCSESLKMAGNRLSPYTLHLEECPLHEPESCYACFLSDGQPALEREVRV